MKNEVEQQPENIEIEVSPSYIKKMESEGMWDAQSGVPAEYPDCPYYMSGYRSVR